MNLLKIDENVQREIMNHRSLKHPNIVEFKESFCCDQSNSYEGHKPAIDLPPKPSQDVVLQQILRAKASLNKCGATKAHKTKAGSTYWIASSLTRQFGLGAGLAWATFLAVGVVSEQIRTQLEVSEQEANTGNVEKEEEIMLADGIRANTMGWGPNFLRSKQFWKPGTRNCITLFTISVMRL